jgi:hypothetical protein
MSFPKGKPLPANSGRKGTPNPGAERARRLISEDDDKQIVERVIAGAKTCVGRARATATPFSGRRDGRRASEGNGVARPLLTASQQVRPALLKGPRTPRRRAGRRGAGRSRKPIKRPDGRAPTTARRRRRSASPDAATQGRPGPGRHDRGAGRARRERTLPAMAQPLGRDPSRPFAALAAHEDPSLSHPGHGVRRARQRDAARPAFHFA